MGMEWIRGHYGVPAKRGGRVEYRPREGSEDDAPVMGTITGADGQYLRIRLDGETRSGRFHPTWQLAYLAARKAYEDTTHD